MITPNIHFDGTPIEYKEINLNDFDNSLYNLQPKKIIKPNDEGYISDNLLPLLMEDKENRNTTVINAGVGQGKTRAIINMVSNFSKSQDYVVIIAVPYKSLIEQYVKECSEYLSDEKIFNLSKYEEECKRNRNTVEKQEWDYTDPEEMIPFVTRLRSYKVHIMTINALLGNPGDDNLFTSRIRSQYFFALKEYCKNEEKKIVWLFDEIHDSIHNFKEQFIYNLWDYKGLIHKAYIVSATFNEASKEVIKYVSEFTEKNIYIIESERIPVLSKQSRLHLSFYVDQQLDRDSNLISLVSDLVKEDKPFDILVYSKSLAEKLIKSNKSDNSSVKKVSDILKSPRLLINRCFSDAFNSKANKRYHESKINIGTNFSTGINIEKANHTFIILFPKDLSVDYVNNKGIFNNGSNVIIQALARQRKKGDIHVFLPNPDGIKLESLPYEIEQNEVLHECFEKYKRGSNKEVRYSSINSQRALLEHAYDKLIKDSEGAREEFANIDRSKFNRLLFPPKEIFILDKGEKYITKEFFSGNLPSYVLWGAISNQFLNCRLNSVNSSNRLSLDNENIYADVINMMLSEIEVLNSLIGEFKLFQSFNGYEKIEFVRSFIKQYSIYINGKKVSLTDKNKILLMLFLVILEENEEFELREAKKSFQKLYLRSCIHYSKNLQEIEGTIRTKDIKAVKVFKDWKRLVDIIDSSKVEVKGAYRLSLTPSVEFESMFNELKFLEGLTYLIDFESILSTDILQFKDTINKAIKNKRLIDSFYKECIKINYNFERKQTSKNGKKTSYYLVEPLDQIDIPNLLHKPIPEFIL